MISILAVLMIASPPTAEVLAERQAAFDSGYERGIGAPLMGWGLLTSVVGGVLWGAFDAEVEGGILSGLGAAQLVAGTALAIHGSRPEGDEKADLAWQVGRARGLGNTLIGYGIALGVGVAFSLTARSAGLSVGLALTAAGGAGLHLGFGAEAIDDGWRVYDRFRAPTRTTMVALPALRF